MHSAYNSIDFINRRFNMQGYPLPGVASQNHLVGMMYTDTLSWLIPLDLANRCHFCPFSRFSFLVSISVLRYVE
jgi:hypothetical protein